MTITPPHPTWAALAATLLLAGCAQPSTVPSRGTAGATAHASTTVRLPHSQPTTPTMPTTATTPTTAETTETGNTGIPACDDYLSSYLACHRAAQIYPPDQLPARYEAMRSSLLRDSKDPATRPQLAARCNSLANQLHQALHGKACSP